jgi:hypothetical protein
VIVWFLRVVARWRYSRARRRAFRVVDVRRRSEPLK